MKASTSEFRQILWVVLVVSAWVNASEVFRYFVIVMPATRQFLSTVPDVAPMDWKVFLVWGVWDTVLTVFVVATTRLFTRQFGNCLPVSVAAGTLAWAGFFVLFWLALYNMRLSSLTLPLVALPLAWLEMVVAACLASWLFGESKDGASKPAADDSASGHGSIIPLTLLEAVGRFAVCKLPPDSPVPAWARAGDVFSVTRTGDELSVVCRQDSVPAGTQAEAGWRCQRVAGAMPFTVVGVLASLTTPVARAGVGVFAVSTFDTDYLLVKEAEFPTAVAALRGAGHSVEVQESGR